MSQSDPVSDRKIDANRLNAQKSTGPRTDAGKAISSQNAMKHAIFCKSLVVPGEDPEEAWKFRHEMVRALNPHNILEMNLAEQVIHDEWRIKRIHAAEQKTYVVAKRDLAELELQRHFTNMRKRREAANNAIEQFQRYELRLRNSAYRAMKELRLMQEKRLHKYEPLSPYAGATINAENEARDAAEESDLVALAEAHMEAAAAAKQAAVLQNEATATASEAQQGACAAGELALDQTNRDVAAGESPASPSAEPNPPDSDARAA